MSNLESLYIIDIIIIIIHFCDLWMTRRMPTPLCKTSYLPRKISNAESINTVDCSGGKPSTLGTGSFGEWGLRLLISETLSSGLLTQTVDGWGGDSYRLFTDSGGNVAIAILYTGDTLTDTEEVTQAFIDLAEDVLDLGDGTRSDGGQVYSRNGRPWMFVDREDTGLLVVISSVHSAGQELADALSPP